MNNLSKPYPFDTNHSSENQLVLSLIAPLLKLCDIILSAAIQANDPNFKPKAGKKVAVEEDKDKSDFA